MVRLSSCIRSVLTPDAAASAVQDFLNRTASQLTPSGIAALFNQMSDGEIAVLFRNNHFNTMLKRDGMLYVLLTDEGFLFETVVCVPFAHRFVS